MELATAVSQMEYDLPLGDRFSSDPGGAELLAAAVDAALKGDLSGFSGGQEISDLVSEMLESTSNSNEPSRPGSQPGDFNLASALSAMQSANPVEPKSSQAALASPGPDVSENIMLPQLPKVIEAVFVVLNGS
ncbi:hypothetical protein [Ruegeria sp. HKCCSP335]|uniref:hypothetical protein n=1 Tax=Ruegeria sp. HKCCSP335 TaxID=2794833 RepID=UPI001AEA0B80|nr:hypothetical protein [Ruegeria sp. HKCCSP335]